jgi:hypothetical protein
MRIANGVGLALRVNSPETHAALTGGIMRSARVLFSILTLAVLLHAAPARAASFTFDSVFDAAAGRLDVNVGLVDIADILPGSFGIVGFEFDVAFDTSLLSTDPDSSIAVTPGAFFNNVPLFGLGFFDPLRGEGGAFTVASILLGPVEAGAAVDATLATVSFFGLTADPGASLLISSILLSRLVEPSELFPDGIDTVRITPPPTAVPEPSSLALAALGLFAAAAGRRAVRGRAR